MRAAEERYPGFPETAAELMERAGAAVADEVLRVVPRGAAHRRRVRRRRERRRRADRRADAPRGRARRGRDRRARRAPTSWSTRSSAPGSTARRGPRRPPLIERINAARQPGRRGRPALRRRRLDRRGRGRRRRRRPHRHLPRPQGRARRRARAVPRRRGRRRGHRSRRRADRGRARDAGDPRPRAAPRRRATRSSPPGSVLVVGGSPGMTAPRCSPRPRRSAPTPATSRSPCRRRRCRSPRRSRSSRSSAAFEWASAADALDADLGARVALAVGPGLGRSAEAGRSSATLLERSSLPVVVDADGLFGLEPVARDAPTVLTPHAGELARLLGRDSRWVAAHRLEAAAARLPSASARSCS